MATFTDGLRYCYVCMQQHADDIDGVVIDFGSSYGESLLNDAEWPSLIGSTANCACSSEVFFSERVCSGVPRRSHLSYDVLFHFGSCRRDIRRLALSVIRRRSFQFRPKSEKFSFSKPQGYSICLQLFDRGLQSILW